MKRKLIMPNHIVVKDGLACGDKVTILYEYDNGNMNFNIIPKGCSVCEKMCEFLQNSMCGMNAESIEEKCKELIRCIEVGQKIDELNSIFRKDRKECMVAPVRLLEDCAKISAGETEYNKVDLYVDKMDCDACAVRENVSWLYQKPRHIHGQYTIDEKKRTGLMKLGRLSMKGLTEKEAKEIYLSLTEDDFEFMEEYKLFPMVYQNLSNMKIIEQNDRRWRLLVYQQYRTRVAQHEINNIDNFIKGREAFWVKGAYTRKFYEQKSMRNLTDFDLLVLNEKDAFEIIEFLLKYGYKIFPDSFSLKKTKQNDKYVYTGHLHFQKIINLQYRMIVDINFTGFPMIRVASYQPKIEENRVSLESMLVVTLCHLFKHKEVFMKDINDLYLMLNNPQISYKKLKCELCDNNLEELFRIVIDYLVREYGFSGKLSQLEEILDEYYVEGNTEYIGWPYDEKFEKQLKRRVFENYTKELVEVERIYLHPVLIFKSIVDVDEILKKIPQTYTLSKLSEKMYEIHRDGYYFVVTPIGIFLEMKEYYVEEMKKRIQESLVEIYESINIACEDIPYAIAFEEKWLDTEKE